MKRYFEVMGAYRNFVSMKKVSLFLIFAIGVMAAAYSQASFDDNVIDVAVPVDGGIVSVVGSALVYGLYRNRKK